LGETLPILQDPYEFVEEHRAGFGPVFHTNVLAQETAVLCGPDACPVFIDPANITRVGAQPPSVAELFGGATLTTLDGAEHRARKALVLHAFSDEALDSYLPIMQTQMEA